MNSSRTICILAADDKVDIVRDRAKTIAEFANHNVLRIPCSASGDLPATHWLCTFQASKDVIEKINGLREFSEIEVNISPMEFLEARNLKRIRRR